MNKRQDSSIDKRISALEQQVSALNVRIGNLATTIHRAITTPVVITPSLLIGGVSPVIPWSPFLASLGYFAKTFVRIGFEKGKWDRSGPDERGCFTYTAKEDGATVSVTDSQGHIEAYKGKKGKKVIVCGSTAHFDEDFEEM